MTENTAPALPGAFSRRMKASLGPEFGSFLAAHAMPFLVSVRNNAAKSARLRAALHVPWADTGRYLPQRPVFALEPHWHAGGYYVQEASSMFLEQAWAAVQQAIAERPVVLDLCAAPGGKSTHLASLLPVGGLLVTNEVIRPRAQVLAENIAKWGTGNAVVTNSDPQAFGNLPGLFDVVLVDAPCSGEGMFRKDPEAVQEWSEANVKLCAERQRRILADVWPALKPGGFLIYSTCTYSPDENEQILDWLAEQYGAEGQSIAIQPDWGVLPVGDRLPGYRFYPHRVAGEGLFMAVLRKPDGSAPRLRPTKKPTWQKAARTDVSAVNGWLQHPETWDWLRWQEKLVALPVGTHPVAEQLAQALRIVYAGVDVAEIVRTQANPLPPLALSADLRTDAFATEDVDLENALRFLSREETPLTEGKGWKLITYQKNLPLGWVKQIGHRANNYFPSEWRLRMDWREQLRGLPQPPPKPATQ